MPSEPLTVREWLKQATTRIDRLDAEVLLAHALGQDRLPMLMAMDRVVDAQGFPAMVERRARGEPVAYIIGEREFWSLTLKVTPDTLIPRPDTETLIAEALAERAGNPPATILDLGTGSGALLLAALSEWPTATGMGVDQSVGAVEVARQNAEALGLAARATIRVGNWADGVDGPYDLILCNPPYIMDGTPLMVDVAEHEPHSALFAGADGLDDYRRLLPEMHRLLAPAGVALFEFGEDQAPSLEALAASLGLSSRIAADLEARPRVLVVKALGKPFGSV